MRLSELIAGLNVDEIIFKADAKSDPEISALIYDSRKAVPGCLFVAMSGAAFDGHAFIRQVADAGAAAVIYETGKADPSEFEADGVIMIPSDDTRRALALVSAAYFGYPAKEIPVIGITGTKGKTTSTYMIKSILDLSGMPTGLIGTIESIIGDEHIHALNTTPESYVIQESLRKMVDAGMKCAVMEVSSQALMMHRTDGIDFEVGVFTNLSEDHIGPNEHSSFDEYLACKSLLFRQCALGIANADDPYCDRILEGHTCKVETFGITNKDADLRAVDIEHVSSPGHLGMSFRVEGTSSFDVELDLPGLFSVYNALTAIAVCRHFGIDEETVRKALRSAKVKGRIEPVKISDDFILLIDYAHNAMALESLLATLRDYSPSRIVCLFGCGGNRAKSRRYEMGEVSGRLADLTVVTSDNPRFEEPDDIIADIMVGIKKTDGEYVMIPDRREAIAWVIDNAKKGDVVVLAGKGHEDYQEIKGVRYPMDERVIIKEIVDERSLR